jgi:hypothetical protein
MKRKQQLSVQHAVRWGSGYGAAVESSIVVASMPGRGQRKYNPRHTRKWATLKNVTAWIFYIVVGRLVGVYFVRERTEIRYAYHRTGFGWVSK